MLTPALQIKDCETVRRIRELPCVGDVLCKVGQSVKSGDIVARAALPGDIQILRIAEKLQLQPKEVLRGLKIKQGDKVKEGQLLFEYSALFGLLKSTYESPCTGTVEAINSEVGHVVVRLAEKPIEIDAYIDGKVQDIVAGKSVTIESSAALIQGIFGIGGEQNGIIKMLACATSKALDVGDIPNEVKGAILVGGTRPSYEAIRCAADRGAVALIVGAIDDAALRNYLGYDLGIALTGDENVPMSVVVTEGFGEMPISSRVIEVLSKLEGKRASVNGATQVRAGAQRPEIIVPTDDTTLADLPKPSSVESAFPMLTVGSKVRIIRVPYFGEFATVVEMPHDLQSIPSGVHTRVLRAKLDSGESVVVARANVELVVSAH